MSQVLKTDKFRLQALHGLV